MEMKMVLKLSVHDDKDKKKAIKAASSIEGIDSISVDMKESKMTVIGDVDPVLITSKLKKRWGAQIVTVGPAKEEKKETKAKDDKTCEEQFDEFIKLFHKYYGQHPHLLHCCVNHDPNPCPICY